jgi:hypothetical protein
MFSGSDIFFVSPLGKTRFRKLIKCLDERERRYKMSEERLALAKKKGFVEGCQIRLKRNGKICTLKMVSSDGFLILPGSSNRENPKDWDIVA